MVQRKVTNKLGIQPDQVKTNKLLVNLKPSSSQLQDATKHKGADLKKKMKKSRPTKRSDLERLGSPNITRQVPQPGKPPPLPPPEFRTTSVSAQKKSPIKTSETTPNYMKATTSSDARKERSQVSSRNLQTLFDSKSSSRKDSNSPEIRSGSFNKAARGLARTSSLKLVRTLTKTTSFKPARASAKKCSPLVLSESLDVQRATCSSTLKDSKFPTYLELGSGGTEAEGTSVRKVCPYTYCSLNGHHHPPLPPLKSFLSARRRMLKTQRSFKLGCLSPRRSKPISSRLEDIQVEQMNFDEKSPDQEPLISSTTSPVTAEEHTDFFVQIFCKESDTTADTTDSSSNHIWPPIDGRPVGDETATQVDNMQVLQIHSDKSPFSEVDSQGESSENGDAVSSDMEAANYQEMDHNIEAGEEVYSILQAQEKSNLQSLGWSDSEVKSRGMTPTENPEFGPSDMDCDAEDHSTMYLDYEADNSLKSNQDSDLEGDSGEFGSCIIPEVTISKLDIADRCFGEIQAGVIVQQSSDEESFAQESLSEAGSYEDNVIEDYFEGLGKESHDQLNIEIEDESINPIKTEDLIDFYKDEPGKDDVAAAQIYDLDSQDFDDMTERSSIKEWESSLGSKDEIDDYQYDNDSDTSSFNLEALNDSFPHKEKDSESEKNSFELELAIDVEDRMEKKELVDPVKALIRIEICISLQDTAEATKDNSREERDGNHLEDIETSGKSDQTLPGIDLTDKTPDYSADKISITCGSENLNCLEENEATNCEASESADLGEETHSTPKDASATRACEDHQGNHSRPELAETCKNINWRTGRKRSVEESMELNEFNPREPNFLPVEPDPEAEKVDLRHQMMDERKNADEWMLDYAIQKAVNQLAPARKKKVALLVEAFETVMPVPRYEAQLRNSSIPFSHAPPIQACS